jgi:hypothetical protein
MGLAPTGDKLFGYNGLTISGQSGKIYTTIELYCIEEINPIVKTPQRGQGT